MVIYSTAETHPPVHKGTRGSSVPATGTQLADMIALWHSVSKRSKKLCVPLAWGSAQKPPLRALQSIRMAPSEDGARVASSVLGELAESLPSALPSHLYSVRDEQT